MDSFTKKTISIGNKKDRNPCMGIIIPAFLVKKLKLKFGRKYQFTIRNLNQKKGEKK